MGSSSELMRSSLVWRIQFDASNATSLPRSIVYFHVIKSPGVFCTLENIKTHKSTNTFWQDATKPQESSDSFGVQQEVLFLYKTRLQPHKGTPTEGREVNILFGFDATTCNHLENVTEAQFTHRYTQSARRCQKRAGKNSRDVTAVTQANKSDTTKCF